MSWPHSNDANTFKQTFLKGYLDISGGDLIQRNGDVSFNNRLFVGGNTHISGDASFNNIVTNNILPRLPETYDIGSLSLPFRSIYLSGNTIYFTNSNSGESASLSVDISSGSISTSSTVEGVESTAEFIQMVNNLVNVQGDISATRIFVYNDVSLNGNLYVKEITIFDNDVSLNKGLIIDGDASLNSDLYVSGSITGTLATASQPNITTVGTLSELTVNGDISLNDRLFVSNDVSLNGDLYVSGPITGTLATASQPNITTVGTLSELTVNGDISLNDRLFVSNDVSFNKNLYVKENLIVDGNVSLKQYNNEYIVNTHTTNYDLIVAEDLSVNGNLFINNDTSLNGDLYVAGSIDGTLSTTAQSNITSVGTLSSLALSGHITPSTHGTINMGTDSLKFNEIHGVNIQSNTITVNNDISFAPNVGVVHQF